MALTIRAPAGVGYTGAYDLNYNLHLTPHLLPPSIAEQEQTQKERLALIQSSQQLAAQFEGQAITDTGAAAASGIRSTAIRAAGELTATGLEGEAAAYTTAAGIAGSNADLEKQAAAIRAFQEDRIVRRTIGSQRAANAANGFAEAGTSLSLLRDSVQQGHITTALTLLQGDINVGGYLAEQLAANADAAAATNTAEVTRVQTQAEADAVAAQQTAQIQSAALARANSANATAAAKQAASEYATQASLDPLAILSGDVDPLRGRGSPGFAQNLNPNPAPLPGSVTDALGTPGVLSDQLAGRRAAGLA